MSEGDREVRVQFCGVYNILLSCGKHAFVAFIAFDTNNKQICMRDKLIIDRTWKEWKTLKFLIIPICRLLLFSVRCACSNSCSSLFVIYDNLPLSLTHPFLFIRNFLRKWSPLTDFLDF